MVCKKEKLCLFGRLVQFALTGFQESNSGVRRLKRVYCSTSNYTVVNTCLHGHRYVCFPYEQRLQSGRTQPSSHPGMEEQQAIAYIPGKMMRNIYMTLKTSSNIELTPHLIKCFEQQLNYFTVYNPQKQLLMVIMIFVILFNDQTL